jgi:TetR/AcrR family transcriptional regulator
MATRRKRASSPRRPGRPPAASDPPDVRDALLEAAAGLATGRSIGEISLREVARAADVTPAMVHYYFGDKTGLHDAMLERALARVLGRVRQAVAEATAEHHDAIGLLLRTVVRAFLDEPWIPPLVVREVFAEGGRFQERFIVDYASHVAPIVRGLVQQEIDAQRFRSDLDATLAFLSLIGMLAMPFVARPVAERVLGVEFDDTFAEKFVEHTRRVFLEGVRR